MVGDTLPSVQQLHLLFRALIGIDLHAFLSTDSADDTRSSRPSVVSDTALAPKLGRRQLSIAVRVLRLVLIKKTLVVTFHDIDRGLFVSNLTVLLGKNGHLVRVAMDFLTLWVVANDRLHWLLVIFATIVAI